tara:strand:+ start:483 stop:605 length:123 start_codon:yes stop_codon:yes gene_type:complete
MGDNDLLSPFSFGNSIFSVDLATKAYIVEVSPFELSSLLL